jgi:hypothetical protein
LTKLNIKPSIGASYQISVYLATRFQRRRLKCEKSAAKPLNQLKPNFAGIVLKKRTFRFVKMKLILCREGLFGGSKRRNVSKA